MDHRHGRPVGWLGAKDTGDAWWTIGLAAAPLPILIPLKPSWWPAPALAAGLGYLSAAVAWPALAGQARGPWTRAVLGAAGFWVTVLISMLTGERLLLEPATSLEHLVRDPAMAVAGVWAAAAALLPLVVRGRNVGVDLLGALVWAAALALGTEAAAGTAVHGLVGATALAALLAVLTGALRRT